ncbi:MAG: PD-(D/E)XK nuclease family protein [Actinobacteria bacterium]|nr:PD-(D/E)XK nuclease family protein [Actinomycetota bacterium]
MSAEPLNPIQQMVLDSLAKRPDFVPSAPGLADEIEAHVSEALEPIAVNYTPAHPLKISKHVLNTVHGCEARYVANRDTFAWSVPLVRGTVLHKAIELLINVRGPRTPSDIVDDALDRIVESERGTASDFIASLSPAEQAELRATVVDLVTKYEDSFPPLKPEWRPVVESNAKAELCGGSIFLTSRTDLTIGPPGSKVIIDLKTGRPSATHREDLRFYSLVEILKSRQAPRLAATFNVDTQRIDAEPVTTDTLRSAVRRLVEGAQLLDELDRRRRPATKSPGFTCRWCSLLSSCDDGRTFLETDSDNSDAY